LELAVGRRPEKGDLSIASSMKQNVRRGSTEKTSGGEDLTGWGIFPGLTSWVSLDAEGNPSSGSLHAVSPPGNFTATQCVTNIQAGESYVLSGYIAMAFEQSPDNWVSFQMDWNNGQTCNADITGSFETAREHPESSVGAWNIFGSVGEAPSGTKAGRLKLWFVNQSGVGGGDLIAWVDEIKVELVPEPKAGMLQAVALSTLALLGNRKKRVRVGSLSCAFCTTGK